MEASEQRPDPAPLLGREDQARERRRQLVAVAGALVVEGGAGAVTLPRVTERARCARTLIYHYFDSLDDLLIAVIDDYFERLDARIPEAEQRSSIANALDAAARADPGPARAWVQLLWDLQASAGLAGAILRTTPVLSPRLQERIEACCARYERRFLDPLQDAGLPPAEARHALDTMTASFVRLALRERAGEIDRDEAIELQARATLGLMHGLLARVGD